MMKFDWLGIFTFGNVWWQRLGVHLVVLPL